MEKTIPKETEVVKSIPMVNKTLSVRYYETENTNMGESVSMLHNEESFVDNSTNIHTNTVLKTIYICLTVSLSVSLCF